MSRRIRLKEFIRNREAHSRAEYYGGKIHYMGNNYTYSEFNIAFPLDFEQVLTDAAFDRLKGVNPDRTKVA